MQGSMDRASLSPPATPEGALPPQVPGSSGKLLRAKNKIMSALNRAKTAQRQLDRGASRDRTHDDKFDSLVPAGIAPAELEKRLRFAEEEMRQMERRHLEEIDEASRALVKEKQEAKRYREKAEKELVELRRKVKVGRIEMQRSGGVQMELFLAMKDIATQVAHISAEMKREMHSAQRLLSEHAAEQAVSHAREQEQLRRELSRRDDDVAKLQLELAALAEAAMEYRQRTEAERAGEEQDDHSPTEHDKTPGHEKEEAREEESGMKEPKKVGEGGGIISLSPCQLTELQAIEAELGRLREQLSGAVQERRRLEQRAEATEAEAAELRARFEQLSARDRFDALLSKDPAKGGAASDSLGATAEARKLAEAAAQEARAAERETHLAAREAEIRVREAELQSRDKILDDLRARVATLEQSLQLSQDLCDALARREEARAQGDGDSSPGGVHEALRSAREEVEALRAEKEIAVLEGLRAQEEGRRAQEAARDQATLQYAQREAITDTVARAAAQLSLAHSLAARAASDADADVWDLRQAAGEAIEMLAATATWLQGWQTQETASSRRRDSPNWSAGCGDDEESDDTAEVQGWWDSDDEEERDTGVEEFGRDGTLVGRSVQRISSAGLTSVAQPAAKRSQDEAFMRCRESNNQVSETIPPDAEDVLLFRVLEAVRAFNVRNLASQQSELGRPFMLRRTCSSPATFASARCQLRRWNFPLLQPLALCVHVASTSLSISPPPPDAATVRFLTSLGVCTQARRVAVAEQQLSDLRVLLRNVQETGGRKSRVTSGFDE